MDKLEQCGICGRVTRRFAKKLCVKCYQHLWAKDRKEEVGNRCMDCGQLIWPGAARCRQCNGKQQRKPKDCCIDCGVEITKGCLRCVPCAAKDPERNKKVSEAKKGRAPWNKGKQTGPLTAEHRQKIGRASRNITEETRRKLSESHKKYYETHDAWNKGKKTGPPTKETREKIGEANLRNRARGVYDGVFHSPTQPEKEIMRVLDELDINYEFDSFRLESYTYDFYLSGCGVLVEYDGWHWHYSERAVECGRPELDATKDKLAKEAGLKLIRLKGRKDSDLSYEEIRAQLSSALSLHQKFLLQGVEHEDKRL